LGLQALFFYLFAFVAVASAFMVISARNPVYSVLFLILTFFNSAGLFLLTGAEFLALILLVVYVGAVAVLFLFVAMMLDIDIAPPLRQVRAAMASMMVTSVSEQTDTSHVVDIFYTSNVYFLQIAGLVFLVAMTVAIVLSPRHRQHSQRLEIPMQVARTRETA